VHKELGALGSFLREPGHQLAGVDDQMLTGFEIDRVLLHPFLEHIGTREHSDALALAQAVPGFLADHTAAVLEPILGDGGRRHPKFINLDAAFALIFGSVLEPEEIASPIAMVSIKVGEADDVEGVAPNLPEISAELLGEIAAQVPDVVRVALVAKVDENLPPIGQIEPKGIGIAERKNGNIRCHTNSPGGCARRLRLGDRAGYKSRNEK
jgi:hypothetical protein